MIKYTDEQEEELFTSYAGADNIDAREQIVILLAKKFNKPTRSIIAKLSKRGIYISKAKISKITGNKPETKEQLVAKIEQRFGVEVDSWMGLEKSPKMVLVALLVKNPRAV